MGVLIPNLMQVVGFPEEYGKTLVKGGRRRSGTVMDWGNDRDIKTEKHLYCIYGSIPYVGKPRPKKGVSYYKNLSWCNKVHGY